MERVYPQQGETRWTDTVTSQDYTEAQTGPGLLEVRSQVGEREETLYSDTVWQSCLSSVFWCFAIWA